MRFPYNDMNGPIPPPLMGRVLLNSPLSTLPQTEVVYLLLSPRLTQGLMLGAVGTGQSPAPTSESNGGLDGVSILRTTPALQHIGQSLRAGNPLESI